MEVEEIPAPPLQTYSLGIYYGTQTGTAKQFAQQLARAAEARGITTSVCDLKDCDPEDTLTQEVRREGGRGECLLHSASLCLVLWACQSVPGLHLH